MKKEKRNFGMVTFYVRPEYRKLFERYCLLIEHDRRIADLRFKKTYGLLSISLNQSILAYNDKADRGELKEYGITEEVLEKINRKIGEIENDESNKNTYSEET